MREFVELKERINRVLDEIMSRAEPGDLEEGSTGEWSPRVDLYELPDRVVIRADLPGLSTGDMDVRMEGAQLVIMGTRRQPQDLDPSAIRRIERPFGSFVRRYNLPDGVDGESIKASYDNGVLEVVVRKREETAVRRIPIES